MTAATKSLTKAEEMAALDRFISEQSPESYLRSILGKLRAPIATAIANDFCVVDWNPHELERQARELKAQVEASQRQLIEIEAKKRRAESSLEMIGRQAEAAAENLDGLARKARMIGI